VVDALGNILSHDGERSNSAGIRDSSFISPMTNSPPPALKRTPISEVVPTGIRVIDGLVPIGKGQRMGIFAPAGVGKSTLLGALARNTKCDVVVAALIGERGREVREFIDEVLGPDALARSVVVYATSDEPPARRMLAASTATAIAESFRAQGKHVLLMVDSLTRVARAIREVSLCMGELPVRQGYTPSVFTELPRLLERAGTNEHGAITALYTVLSSDENDTDVLREELLSLLDGHLCMTNQVALRGIRPAIDPTRSLSRLCPALSSTAELSAQTSVRTAIARLWKEKDMLMFGGTADESLKHLLSLEPTLNAFLAQNPHESIPLEQTKQQLGALAALISKGP
jgi:type III secretion protein N (ATPase)